MSSINMQIGTRADVGSRADRVDWDKRDAWQRAARKSHMLKTFSPHAGMHGHGDGDTEDLLNNVALRHAEDVNHEIKDLQLKASEAAKFWADKGERHDLLKNLGAELEAFTMLESESHQSINAGKRDVVKGFITERQMKYRVNELKKLLQKWESQGQEHGEDDEDEPWINRGYGRGGHTGTQELIKAAESLGFRRLSTPRDWVNALHNLNLGLQPKQPFFELMEQYVKTRDFVESDNRHESDEKMKLKSKLKLLLTKYCSRNMMKVGVVGEIPVHVAFLMGEHELGMHLILADHACVKRTNNLTAASRMTIVHQLRATMNQFNDMEHNLSAVIRKLCVVPHGRSGGSASNVNMGANLSTGLEVMAKMWHKKDAGQTKTSGAHLPCGHPAEFEDVECLWCHHHKCRECSKLGFAKDGLCSNCKEPVCMGCMLCFQCGLHANREFLEDTAWEHLKLHLDLDHAKAHSSKDEFCAARLLIVTGAGVEVCEFNLLEDIDDFRIKNETKEKYEGVMEITFRSPITSMQLSEDNASYSPRFNPKGCLHVKRMEINRKRCDMHHRKGEEFPGTSHGNVMSDGEWTLLMNILNIQILRQQRASVIASIVNTPYASDLSKWLDSESGDKNSLLEQVRNDLEKRVEEESPKTILSSSMRREQSYSTSPGKSLTKQSSSWISEEMGDWYTIYLNSRKREKDLKSLKKFIESAALQEARCTIRVCALPHVEEDEPRAFDERGFRLDKQMHPPKCSICKGSGGKDGGMFTGETLLHIAIVQHQLDSIEWLLNHGAHVDSRALGIFFQDSIIPRFVDDLGLLQRHGPKQYRMQTNSQGGTCEYGEFPLSFAASVGDEHICHLICERADHLISLAVDGLKQLAPQVNTAHEDHDFFIEESEVNFLKTELDQVIRRNVENGEGLLEYLDGQLKKHRHSDGVSKEEQFYRDLLRSAFLNRRDSQGNTALHQAVKYRRISTIDWLLNNGAEHSLSILNDEDLTPLTLAVRLGDTTTFEHLVTCQRVNVWRYGTVCMDIMSLEQIDTFRIAPEKKTNDRDPSVFRRFYRTYLLPVWCGGIPREKVPTKVFPSPSKASFKWSSHGKVTSDHYRDVLPYRKLVEDSQPNKYLVRDRERHDGIEHMHSDPFWRSALEVVVENEIDEFIDCDNGSIFQDLVSQKWNSFARGYHIWWELGPFSLFVGLLTCSCFYRVAAIWELHVGPYYNTESDQFVRVLVPTNDPEMYKTIVVWLYGFVFLGGIPYLFYRALIERRLSARDLDPNEDLNLDFVEILFFVYKNLSTTLSFLIAVLLVTQGSLWLLHDDYWDGKDLWAWNIESQLMCFIMLFAWLKVVHMLLPFEGIGRLLITVWRMFMSDIITWLILVIFVLIAFSLATGIIVRSNFIVNRDIIDLEKQSVLAGDMPFMPFDQIMSYISVMLGEVQHPSVTTQGFQTALQRFMHIIYNIIATLLLQNLIIAMMGDTYARERENEGFAMWWMNHASLVLRYERRISRRNRIRHRTGTDLNKGDDFPECRPYFSVTVGPDKQMEDVWNNATRHVSSEELNDNIDAHFQTVKQSFQVLLHRLQRTVDVRFKILDAKINTIFKQVHSAPGHPVASGAHHRQWMEDVDVSAQARKDFKNPDSWEKVGRLSQGTAVLRRSSEISTVSQESAPEARPESRKAGAGNIEELPKNFAVDLFLKYDTAKSGFITREQTNELVVQVMQGIRGDGAGGNGKGLGMVIEALIAQDCPHEQVTAKDLSSALQRWLPSWKTHGLHGLSSMLNGPKPDETATSVTGSFTSEQGGIRHHLSALRPMPLPHNR